MEHQMMTMDFVNRMERMHPDAAAMLMPHVNEMVDSHNDLHNVTESEVHRMAGEAVNRIGDNMPMGHTVQTMGDLSRALLVREIIDRGRRFDGGGFPFFPFVFFPFDGRRGRGGWNPGWSDGRNDGWNDGRRSPNNFDRGDFERGGFYHGRHF